MQTIPAKAVNTGTCGVRLILAKSCGSGQVADQTYWRISFLLSMVANSDIRRVGYDCIWGFRCVDHKVMLCFLLFAACTRRNCGSKN